jgi:hypothetical protein
VFNEQPSAVRANVRVCILCGIEEFALVHVDAPYTHDCVYPNATQSVEALGPNTIDTTESPVGPRRREAGARMEEQPS